MVDVRVRKHDGVDLSDVDRKRRVFGARLAAASLKHSAIQQDGLSIDAQDVTRAGHFTSGARELDLHQEASCPLVTLRRPLDARTRGSPDVRPATSWRVANRFDSA